MAMKRITFDTSTLPAESLFACCEKNGWDYAIVTVTVHEVEGTSFQVGLEHINQVFETAIFGESRFNSCVFGNKYTEVKLSDILSIISNNSFPEDRSCLTKGQKNQLRDASILEAHLREGRDIFVTEDKRGFINDGRKETIENRFGIKIMTKSEFEVYCRAQN